MDCFRCCKKVELPKEGPMIWGKELPIIEDITLIAYMEEGLRTGRLDPKSTALIYHSTKSPVQYTLGEFWDLSSRLAVAIKVPLEDFDFKNNNTNEDGDIVIGFCLGTTARLVLTIFAILKLQCTYLPFDIMCPEEQIAHIYNGVKPVLVITENHAPVHTRFICLNRYVRLATIDELMDIAEKMEPNPAVSPFGKGSAEPWELASGIYYTSGTTGPKKGIRYKPREIFNRIQWQWDALPYEKGEIACLLSQPMIHTSITEIFAPMVYGVPLVVANRITKPKPDFLAEIIKTWKINRISVSSAVLISILDVLEKAQDPLPLQRDLSPVKIWVCVGDTLTFQLAERFFNFLGHRRSQAEKEPEEGTDAGGDSSEVSVSSKDSKGGAKPLPKHKKAMLVHLYGTTETTADCVFETFEDLAELLSKSSRYMIPYGLPIANTQIYLDDMEEDIGEICVSGASVSRYTVRSDDIDMVINMSSGQRAGYMRTFQTNDLGRITPGNDGIERLYGEGRVGAIAKVKGKQIDVNVVARTIRATGFVEDVEVLMYHAGREDQVMVAASILKPDIGVLDILSEIKDQLPKDAIPEIFPIPVIPLLGDGRMDRRMILELYRRNRLMCRARDWASLGLPLNQMDATRTLCEAVAHSIGISIRHVIKHFRSSYWELGGSSNNAVICVCRIKAKDYYLPLDEFLTAATLYDIMLRMMEASRPRNDFVSMTCDLARSKFKILHLAERHKDAAIKIISTAYPEKNELACCTGAQEAHFQLCVAGIFSFLLKANLSLVAECRKTGHIVAVMLCVDAHSKPKYAKTFPKQVKYLFEVMQEVETQSRDSMKYGSRSKVIVPYLVGTSESCSPAENVILIQLLLKQTIEKAKAASFTDLFVISSLPLMRQLCRLALKYVVLTEFQVAGFVAADKTRPFKNAGTYHKLYCFGKNLLL